MRAANDRRGDIGIDRLPFHHQALRPLEIVIVHLHLHAGLRLGHECDLLQVTFIVDISLKPGLLKALFQPPGFAGLIKCGDRHHSFILPWRGVNQQTSTNDQRQESEPDWHYRGGNQ